MFDFEINTDNKETERGICIICPGHANIGHELAHTLISLHHDFPLVALRRPMEDSYKIIIPQINIDNNSIIKQAIEELNIREDLIQILTIEKKEIENILGGMTTRSYINGMMQELGLEYKVNKSMEELIIRDLEYDFSTLLKQEKYRSYNYKYAKKFHQRKQGKQNKIPIGLQVGHIKKK